MFAPVAIFRGTVMRLGSVLAISAALGATLPLGSFILWFALNFGDRWAAMHRYVAENWPGYNNNWSKELLIDFVLGAILNVPIYMVIGFGLWAVFGRTRPITR
jgi:hypothetical protein